MISVSRGMTLVLCACTVACGFDHTNVHGTVSVQGSPTLGTTSHDLDDCEKSEGVTLLDRGVAIIAVANDPVSGSSIELPDPAGGVPMVLYARNCRALSVDTHFNGVTVTNNQVSNDQELSGSVSADCDLLNGGTVTANATFQNCL